MKKYNKLTKSMISTALFLFMLTYVQGMQQESIPQGLEQQIEQIRKDWDIPGTKLG